MRAGETVMILYDEEGNTDFISVFSLEEKTDGAIFFAHRFAGH